MDFKENSNPVVSSSKSRGLQHLFSLFFAQFLYFEPTVLLPHHILVLLILKYLWEGTFMYSFTKLYQQLIWLYMNQKCAILDLYLVNTLFFLTINKSCDIYSSKNYAKTLLGFKIGMHIPNTKPQILILSRSLCTYAFSRYTWKLCNAAPKSVKIRKHFNWVSKL